MIPKLTLVVRNDLRAGQQAVQSVHAFTEFAHQHPDIEREWYASSNTLALLSVPDESTLRRVLEEAEGRGIRRSHFREPDLGDQVTALCLEPSPEVRRLCRGFPLALRGP